MCVEDAKLVLSSNPEHVLHGVPELGEAVELCVVVGNGGLVDPVHGAWLTAARHTLVQQGQHGSLARMVVTRAIEGHVPHSWVKVKVIEVTGG